MISETFLTQRREDTKIRKSFLIWFLRSGRATTATPKEPLIFFAPLRHRVKDACHE